MNSGKNVTYTCHKITGGAGVGEILVSSDDICFSQADPDTGVVIEKNHAIEGRNITDKILVFPSGKGSSVVQGTGLYQLIKKGTAPKALIIKRPDTVLVASAVVHGIPLVDRVEEAFYKQVGNGSRVKVDADNCLITLMKDC